jgi:predicted RNA-binding Zn-ribbon protein involved in translation (DUF1610 family)
MGIDNSRPKQSFNRMTTKLSSTKCGSCGVEIDPAEDAMSERVPCPQCGGLTRAHPLTAGEFHPSNYLLDNFFAHRLSELTQCDAPEIDIDAKWLNNFILNSIFRVRLPEKTRSYSISISLM